MKQFIYLIIGIFILNSLLIGISSGLGHFFPAGMLAYTLRDARPNNNDSRLIDTRTGISFSLLQGIGDEDTTGRTPIWSHDGNAIAFWTFQNRQDMFVHEISLPQYNIQNLTRDQAYMSLPIYGVEDQRLFGTFPTFNNVAVYLVTDDHPEGDVIIPSSLITPRWSPNGRYLIHMDTYTPPEGDEEIDSGLDQNELDLYLTDVLTRDVINLTEDTPASGVPIWLPDSSGILFFSTQGTFGRLYQLNLTIGEVTEVTTDIRPNDIPQISPDGRYLLYTGGVRNFNQRDIEIFVLDLETLETQNISQSPLYDNQPVWSPDGTHIAYISRRMGVQDEIFITNFQTGHTRRLTFTDLDEEDLMWRPR